MVLTCAVVGCSARWDRNIRRTFHCFPFSDEKRLQEWVRRISRVGRDGKPWTPTKASRVCSDHFVAADYEIDTQNRFLRNTAVPSVFGCCPSHKKTTHRSPRRQTSRRKWPKSDNVVLAVVRLDHNYSAPPVEPFEFEEPGQTLCSTTGTPTYQPSTDHGPFLHKSGHTVASLTSADKKHVCQRCSASFVMFNSLKVHMVTFHGENLHPQLPVSTTPDGYSGGNVDCDFKIELNCDVEREDDCNVKREVDRDADREVDYGVNREVDYVVHRAVDYVVKREIDSDVEGEFDYGVESEMKIKEVDCVVKREVDSDVEGEFDYGVESEMKIKEVDCVVKREVDSDVESEFGYGVESELKIKEVDCVVKREVDSDVESEFDYGVEREMKIKEVDCVVKREVDSDVESEFDYGVEREMKM